MNGYKHMQMKTLRYFVIIFFLISSSNCYAETLTIGVNDWCPHVCDPSAGQSAWGYTTDIAMEILTEAGFNVEPIVAPWRRILIGAKNGTIDIVASGYKEEAPFLIFSENFIGTTEEIFYTRKHEVWNYTGIASLQEIESIGVINGADYQSSEFASYIEKNPQKIAIISGNNIVLRQLKMLA